MTTPYEKLEARLERYCLTGIEIRPKPAKRVAVGASKYGGRPDLPADVAWPTWSEKTLAYPFTFIGQVALEDVARLDADKLLPKAGLLAFFALVIHHAEVPATRWKSAPWEAARAIYAPAKTKLVRKAPPPELRADLELPESKMSFRKVTTWPQCEGLVIGERSPKSPKGPYAGRVKLKEEEWSGPKTRPRRRRCRCSATRVRPSIRSA
jgi:hypothetical protein